MNQIGTDTPYSSLLSTKPGILANVGRQDAAKKEGRVQENGGIKIPKEYPVPDYPQPITDII